MGERLVKFYQAVQEKAGLPGKTKMAMITKVPSTKAALAPDSPSNLELFKQAYIQVIGGPPPKF